MRLVGFLSVAAMLSACGGAVDPLAADGGVSIGPGMGPAGATENGGTSFSGTIAGQPVPTTDEMAAVQTMSHGSGAVSYTALAFTNIPGICGFLQRHENPANATALAIEVQVLSTSGPAPSNPTGTFPVLGGTGSALATVRYVVQDAHCQQTTADTAWSGSVTITQSDGSVVAGSLEVNFPNGDYVSGSFSVPVCTGDLFTTTTCGS
jgi:hypothetical protein